MEEARRRGAKPLYVSSPRLFLYAEHLLRLSPCARVRAAALCPRGAGVAWAELSAGVVALVGAVCVAGPRDRRGSAGRWWRCVPAEHSGVRAAPPVTRAVLTPVTSFRGGGRCVHLRAGAAGGAVGGAEAAESARCQVHACVAHTAGVVVARKTLLCAGRTAPRSFWMRFVLQLNICSSNRSVVWLVRWNEARTGVADTTRQYPSKHSPSRTTLPAG